MTFSAASSSAIQFRQLRIAQTHVWRVFGLEKLLNLGVTKRWPQEGALHPITPSRPGEAWLCIELVPGRECGTDGAAGIAGRGLNPQAFEWPFPQDFAIAHAVQGHPTGQTEMVGAGLPMHGPGEPHHHFFRDILNGACQIHVLLAQEGFGGRGGAPKRA